VTESGQASVRTTDLPVVNTWEKQVSTVNTVIDLSDTRTQRAIVIAADAGQWLKCRTSDGRKAYGIRSSSDGNHIYLTTRSSCTCYDARHNCKHIVAVQLHCALVEEQAPSSKAELGRILGGVVPSTRQQRGVIPANEIERED
jgi:hypothetical protein